MSETDSDIDHTSAHTYIRRRGRFTKAQARGLALLEHRYRADAAAVAAASQHGQVGLEIGFGMGHALLEWSDNAPAGLQLFGIELYQPGIGALCDGLDKARADNVRVVDQPAQVVFAQLPSAGVDEIRIFFPDPWPKKRHQKRRLIQPEFVHEIARVLRPGGVLRMATDWTPYAQWMRVCLATSPALACELDQVRAAAEDAGDVARSTTKFEHRGERLGHEIHDLVYARQAINAATTESR